MVLQSGARWLGLTLDMIGAVIVTILTIPYHSYHTIPQVIVFTSILAAILMDQTNPASLGLLISYRSSCYSHTHMLTN